jgi:NADPH:quinone reductase-like Zn-dependent oxidoreductase
VRAIVQHRYGTVADLELVEREPRVPRPHEVAIAVVAASVNPADGFRLSGRPLLGRFAFGWRRPREPVLGMDLAGRVIAVGAKVTRFAVGDAVFGEGIGAFAEQTCVAEERLAHKPRGVSFEDAASLPIAGQTALQALRDVAPGSRVLVNGASGGVGTFAVQIARTKGAEVTGVCSARNVALVRSLGASHVVDYTRESFTRTSARYDLVLDLVGSASITDCLRILTPGGVYLSSVGRTGRILAAGLRSLISRRVKVLVAELNVADLEALGELVASGAVRPVIERRFALSEVPEAMRHLATGRTRGKSIVCVTAERDTGA